MGEIVTIVADEERDEYCFAINEDQISTCFTLSKAQVENLIKQLKELISSSKKKEKKGSK